MRNYLLIFLKSIKREILKFAKDNNTDEITISDLHNTYTYKGGLDDAKKTFGEIIKAEEYPNVVNIVDENDGQSMGGASKRLATSAYKSNIDQAA